MDVSACMNRDVLALAPDTSLEAAARTFIRHHIGGAPVVDAAGKPIGFLSAKDLLDPDRRHSDRTGTAFAYRLKDGQREAVDAGPVSAPGTVADVMTHFVLSVPPSMALEEAAKLMLSSDLHRLLVVDDERTVVGIVSAMDVMRALTAPPSK